MNDKAVCGRCGSVAESYQFVDDSKFWGLLETRVSQVTTRQINLRIRYWRRNPKYGREILTSDDVVPLCGDCWYDLVLFLQGRAVPGSE